MSHAKERKEKICLNCNTDLHGRYCHVCGQQNIEPRETVWGLITHFFYDITHFDGNFFSTLKYLVAKPGFLPAEYRIGRRARYLNPIRMYIFTSAFFFIIFFSVTDFDPYTKKGSQVPSLIKSDSATLKAGRDFALRFAESREDSLEIMKEFEESSSPDTLSKAKGNDTTTKSKKGWRMSLTEMEYKTIREYDSAQKTLPPSKRDGWIVRTLNHRNLTLREKYGDDSETLTKVWLNLFVHQFPKLLFVSLPIFALILRLLYIRRKQFYYVDHGIFSIYLYIFSFILLLVSMGITGLQNWTGWGIFTWVQVALWIYFLYYNYKAMRVFYKQGRAKTIVKFILLNNLAMISIIILFAIFFIITAFQL